jgi:hypothetical protein
MSGEIYTTEELDRIRKEYRFKRAKTLGVQMGRSPAGIHHKARALGVRKRYKRAKA